MSRARIAASVLEVTACELIGYHSHFVMNSAGSKVWLAGARESRGAVSVRLKARQVAGGLLSLEAFVSAR